MVISTLGMVFYDVITGDVITGDVMGVDNVTSSLYVMMILLMVVTGTGHVGESAHYAIGKNKINGDCRCML